MIFFIEHKGTVIGCALVILSLLMACQADSPANHKDWLLGKWQATSLTEQDSLLAIDLQAVQLEFLASDRYGYHGTLKEMEAGTYRMQKDLLFTIDTTVQVPNEKVVKILKLTPDSLQIEMVDAGKRRVLDLQKME